MGLDAGGLAQMTYNAHNPFNAGLGVPASGFSSRRGGSHGKRLSMAPPTNISTINEIQQPDGNPTPRTSRSHLLAGLRTAPKSPMYPTSAPPTQLQQPYGIEQGRYSPPTNNKYGRGVPQTAVGGSFPSSQRYGMNANGQMYSLPEILAPPELQFGGEQDDTGMDPAVYAELMATNQYLAQQQMRLQQQLFDITAAQQQMQGMNLNSGRGQQQQHQYHQSHPAPSNGFYNQQLQNGLQPIVTPVPGTPGVYAVYNPLTGQQTYVADNVSQHQAAQSGVPNQELSHSPPPVSPAFRAQVSPPPEDNTPVRTYRSPSPPKSSSSPVDVNPLPPPSANAFRRGHAKNLSSVTGFASNAGEGPKSSVPKSAGFPQTPMTGTFGPGQARAGDHPVRQPRGPPSLEELIEKPTSKHEGSKNFITRQRRRAVNNLVRAGLERRGASRGSNSIDSASGTPSSECEITFSVSSDNDSDSIGSRSDSLSGKPSVGSLRAAANGAIGSERKEMKARSRERYSKDTPPTTASVSSDEGFGKKVEMNMDESKENPRSAPLLVLTSAEKRKSGIF